MITIIPKWHTAREHVIASDFDQYLTAARLAQLGERRSAERGVASSNPGRTNTQGLKNNWGESPVFVMTSAND